ncbi:MAG: hypothetical protein ACJ8F1_02790 [Polyangia bacterium]
MTHEPLEQVPAAVTAVALLQVALPQALVGKVQVPFEPQLPAQVPVPAQAAWLLCGVAPAERFVQVPWWPAMSQATHEPVQAVSQQTPSGEHVVPETQPPPAVVQVWPCLLLHAPAASHVPAQRPFGSSALFAATQLCVVVSHFMHVPEQSLLLQQAVMGIQAVVDPVVHDLVDPVHE